VNQRQGSSGRLLVAAMAPWLIRWALLQDSHQPFHVPGLGKKKWIHVVCPEHDCTNQAWITKYEPATVKLCGQHDGSRKRMILCQICQQRPESHPKPNGPQ